MGFRALPNAFSTGERDWTTGSGTADADFTTRRVYAPTDLSDRSAYARAHVNATVACGHESLPEFSRKADVPYEVCAAADYARLSSLLSQTNAVARDGVWDDYEENFDYEPSVPHYHALTLTPGRRLPDGAIQFYEDTDDIVAAYNAAARSCIEGDFGDYRSFNAALNRPIDPHEPDAQRRRLFRDALRRAISKTYETVSRYDDNPTYDSLDTAKCPDTTETAAAAAWAILKEYINRPDDTVSFGHDEVLADDSWDDLDDTEWCTMHFRHPTLVMPTSPKLRRRAWRMSDEGALIRSPHRMCSDGRVFGTIRRKADSGSVLIDTSGSMHLRPEDIDEIMSALPGVTVATYCSDGDYEGELRIVARKNRRARTEDLSNDHWGGNGVDGPALRWLAKQPEPRYWICDGVVTGIHDATAPNLRTECDRLTKRYNITRIHNMHQLREMFSPS